MRRIFEFACDQGHVTERYVDEQVMCIQCPHCKYLAVANRIVSAPQIKLEGITGSFPGAYDRWERVRAEKLQQERKRNASHGED